MYTTPAAAGVRPGSGNLRVVGLSRVRQTWTADSDNKCGKRIWNDQLEIEFGKQIRKAKWVIIYVNQMWDANLGIIFGKDFWKAES